MMRFRCLIACALLALTAGGAAAQSSSSQAADLTPRSTVWSPWGVMRSLTVKDSLGHEAKVSQLSAPMSLNLRMGGNLSAVLYGAFAQTKLEPDSGLSRTLSGITDVRARLFLRAGHGTIFTAGVSLPTGKHALTSEENVLAGLAAQDVLGFRIRRYGEGFGGEFGLTQAFAAGENGAFALGASGVYKSAYEPFVGSTSKYRPGSEISASAGYDYHTARMLLRLNASARLFAKDDTGGVSVFKQASQVLLEQRLVSEIGDRSSNDLYVRELIKGSDETYASTGVPNSRDNGANFAVTERLELTSASGFKVAGIGEANVYGKSATGLAGGLVGIDSAKMFGFGGEVGYEFSRNALFRVSGKMLTGSSDPGGIKLSGYEATASLRAAF